MPRCLPARRFAARRNFVLIGFVLLPFSACSDQSGATGPLEAIVEGKPKPPTVTPPSTDFQHGAFLGDAESTRDSIAGSIAAFTQKVGSRPGLIKTFFRLDDDFSSRGWPGQTIRKVRDQGSVNLIALNVSWNGAPGSFLLNAIIRGDADAHIRRLASGLADVRAPVYLELAWEMNGNWGYPWQGVANGGDSRATSAYVQAWRRIVDVVRAQRVTNVYFVFSPNVGNSVASGLGATHWNWYGHYYPGDNYVDVIGLHGFNGPSVWGGSYATFLDLFDSPAMDRMLSDIALRFPLKKVLISEYASEESAAKPEWIRDAYAQMKARPQVMGAVWFDMRKEADWRVNSSAASLAAYREALAATTTLASH